MHSSSTGGNARLTGTGTLTATLARTRAVRMSLIRCVGISELIVPNACTVFRISARSRITLCDVAYLTVHLDSNGDGR